MISDQQREKARLFADMHKGDKMLVIPNAWDVGSAYIFEKQGFRALATSSAGMAYALGYPDGQHIPFDDVLWIVKRMAIRIDLPLSVDFERGYGESGDSVKENARQLLLAGAVGFNLEDGLPDGTLSPLDLQIEKIKSLAELKRELDMAFVINARTCAYWLNVAGEEDKLAIAVERGNAFLKAGADCVFIPGAMDEPTVAMLVEGIHGPVNIILNAAFRDFARLEKLGVRRLSVGSSPARYTYGKVIELADSLRGGDVAELLACELTYGRANSYFVKQLSR